MTKFWMMVVAILALGLTTGCPDGDDDTCTGEGCICGDRVCNWNEDCASCPADCAFMCADADADTNEDGDVPETSDDADTNEAGNCPNIARSWELTYRNTETGGENHLWITFEQDGCLVTNSEGDCEYLGTISESGYISLFRDCYTIDRTITGNFTEIPPRGDGTWNDSDGLAYGTWTANPG